MPIEIYEQDKYAVPVFDADGTLVCACSATNAAEAIVGEHNRDHKGRPWKVGKTVTLVSAKSIAWRAEAKIDWNRVEAGKSAAKSVKTETMKTTVTLQETKPKSGATSLTPEGSKPWEHTIWYAVASDRDMAEAMAKRAAVEELEAYLRHEDARRKAHDKK